MKDDNVYLGHIEECIRTVNEYCASGEEEFFKARIIQDAVIRNLEIIGEAAKNISKQYKTDHPDIP